MTKPFDYPERDTTQHEIVPVGRGDVIHLFSTPAAQARMIEERQRAWNYGVEPLSPEARAAITPEMRYEAFQSTLPPDPNERSSQHD